MVISLVIVSGYCRKWIFAIASPEFSFPVAGGRSRACNPFSLTCISLLLLNLFFTVADHYAFVVFVYGHTQQVVCPGI